MKKIKKTKTSKQLQDDFYKKSVKRFEKLSEKEKAVFLKIFGHPERKGIV